MVAAVRAGIEEACDQFDQTFRPRVRSLVRSRAPESDVDDIAQAVMVDAFRQIRAGAFRGEAAVWTWLLTIVRGTVATATARRTKKHLRETELELLSANQPELTARCTQEEVVEVNDALESLPLDLRVIFLLRFREGRTVDEISVALDKPRSTVHDWLKRAELLFGAAVLGQTAPSRGLKQRS